jgi:type I restriction enzyme S subunit
MKEGWKMYRLLDICDVYQPATISKKELVVGGLYDVYGANGVIGKYDKFNHEESEVLLGCRGACGCINFSSPRSWINGNAMVVHPRTSDLSKEYLVYLLRTLDYSKVITGTAQPQITRTSLSEVTIPVPPLSEQGRIVSFLDAEFAKIDALKTNTEQQLQSAKDLFQSALKQYLTPKEGWEMKTIGDIFKSYSGGTPLKSRQEYYTTANIPWLNSGEVCRKYITETDNYISEEGLKNSSAKYFPIDTVLVAMYGATAAQAGILKFEATSNQAICGLLPNEKMKPEFVYYWFVYNKEIFASMAQGGAQPNLSQVKIKAMPIPYIAKELQEGICIKLADLEDKVKALQENYNKTLVLCNDLKQSLLKSIFE